MSFIRRAARSLQTPLRIAHSRHVSDHAVAATRTSWGASRNGIAVAAVVAAGGLSATLYWTMRDGRVHLDSPPKKKKAPARDAEKERPKPNVKEAGKTDERLITMDEVGKHNSPKDLWVVIEGEVWDVTDFVDFHPGGAKIIQQNAGKDVTDLYKPIHPPRTLERNLAPDKKVGKVDPATAVKSTGALAQETERLARARAELPPVEQILGLGHMEEVAQTVMAERSQNYYNGGSDDEITLRENALSFRNCRFLPRIMVNTGTVAPQTKIFGYPSPLPIYISPAANALLGHPDAEKNLVRGAAMTGIFQGISAAASLPLDDILAEKKKVEEEQGHEMILGYQVYVQKDRNKTAALIQEAVAGGAKCLFLTVDSAVLGNREKNDRARHEEHEAEPGIRMEPNSEYEAYHDAALCWDDLPWLKDLAKGLPIYLKGVYRSDDVRLAKEHNLAGVILSNHGGRQMDRSRTGFDSLRALHAEAPELLKELEVYVDGGVRRGNDVLAALCLGARGVGLGRSFLYAQAAYGEKGVIRAVRIMEQEIITGLRLLGVTSVADLRPEMIECLQYNWHVPVPGKKS